ncbi:MAG TPA: hypothetical protein VMM77_07345 [Gemmatimonadaceae bacterium]|nr:hypothetical protein [Gemmatimonadaceae bacterium]
MIGGLWGGWRHGRELRARATAYVETLLRDPEEAEVRWLASTATSGDDDHARWELRYARQAIGHLTAQRDALDDQTGSAVAHALSEALGRDRRVAPGKLGVAERQLNERITAYAQALGNREGAGSGWHLGRTLLRFAGCRETVPPEVVARASEIITGYLHDANEALRDAFGAASLPENQPPSALRRS